jgi:hypothetical protein
MSLRAPSLDHPPVIRSDQVDGVAHRFGGRPAVEDLGRLLDALRGVTVTVVAGIVRAIEQLDALPLTVDFRHEHHGEANDVALGYPAQRARAADTRFATIL